MEKKNIQEQEHTQNLDSQERVIPVLPLKNIVLLPKSITPVYVGRDFSMQAVEHALHHDSELFVTAQQESDIDNPSAEDLYYMGCRASILQVMRLPKGGIKVILEGASRAQASSITLEDGIYWSNTTDCHTEKEQETAIEAAWRQLQEQYQTYTQMNPKIPSDLFSGSHTIEDMEVAADTLAMHSNLSHEQRQEILETINLQERLVLLTTYLQKEIDILETEERIRNRVQTQIEKSQREYYLNEQIRAIQKELGRDDQQAEITRLRERADSLDLPEDAADKVYRELHRLEQMPPMSSEATVSKNYVDWITSLPWHTTTQDRLSLSQAEKLLNKNHAGLKEPKERIIEYIATKKFSTSTKSPIICFVGPPGVGKTSLAQSMAQALGREFVRLSLGGIRDEAEIRGHRRTYIGSMPGKIIQSMRKAQSKNPVMLLDEVDKLSSDFQGDPASALLEVLDPEQNTNFTDNYLEAPYDLSQVMFITTANHIEGIPHPLFDRMEVIRLAGYTHDEKRMIAQKFLIPKNLAENGLEPRQFKISKRILDRLIQEYTREAGVRQLERRIAKLMRKAIQTLLKNKEADTITITRDRLYTWLGAPIFQYDRAITRGSDEYGIATGLAWTESGGDLLAIEASTVSGKGNVTLTGQLGNIMQESAQAAISYIRSRAHQLGINPEFSANNDIHIHIPEGATPKDGPSAGITMCTALISALTQTPVTRNIAMTGEITLRGRVLPVGGIKEKLLAARQHGIDTVLLPRENESTVKEVQEEIDTHVNVIFVDNMDQVCEYALVHTPHAHHAAVKHQAALHDKHA